MAKDHHVNARRRALAKGLGLLPLVAAAPAHAARRAPRTVSFYHTHTGERLTATYYERGGYVPDALQAVNWLLRDFRTETVHVIDPRLLDQLYALNACCGGRSFEVISGYRSPQTNAMLRKTSSGVASHSLHIDGRAIDVRLEGCDTERLHRAALAMARGGVGFYPRSDFVHLDTGRFRTWGAA
ncbi:MAG: YcbK family protein [Sphingomonadaceae bacterium]